MGRALFTFIPRKLRPDPSQLTAAAFWGTTFAVGALWLIQPFDWIKAQLSKKEEEKTS